VLEERLNQQQQLASASGSRLTALDSIQALFTPDSGSSSSTAGDIGSDITSFFDSFSSLEAKPTDGSLRDAVLSSASTLAVDISNAAKSLNAQRSALDQQTTGVASQVNALTGAIAQLNTQIQSISPNADAGTLEINGSWISASSRGWSALTSHRRNTTASKLRLRPGSCLSPTAPTTS